MKKNALLTVLLIIQGVLAFLVLTGGRELQRHAGMHRLIEFNREQLDGIHIQDNEGNVVELNYVDGVWLTADQFPVDAGQVDRLLERLNQLQHGLAVAHSASAAKRFEVSEHAYQRRLQLLQENVPVAHLYLGSGAGARRSYVRLAGQAAIYSASIGAYDLSANISDWQDKELLQLEIDTIQSVQIGDWVVHKSSADTNAAEDLSESSAALDVASIWMAQGLVAGERFKAEDFAAQLRNLATLRYTRGRSGAIEHAAVLAAEIVVNCADKSRTYRFYKLADRQEFQLKVSDREEIFELSEFTVKPIIQGLTRQTLVETPGPADVEGAEMEASQPEKSD